MQKTVGVPFKKIPTTAIENLPNFPTEDEEYKAFQDELARDIVKRNPDANVYGNFPQIITSFDPGKSTTDLYLEDRQKFLILFLNQFTKFLFNLQINLEFMIILLQQVIILPQNNLKKLWMD